jgi:hypothetical protein
MVIRSPRDNIIFRGEGSPPGLIMNIAANLVNISGEFHLLPAVYFVHTHGLKVSTPIHPCSRDQYVCSEEVMIKIIRCSYCK